MSIKNRIKFFFFKYGFYSLIFGSIILSACLNKKGIESLLFFIAYISLRYKFPTTYHNETFYGCVFLSILAFWCIIPLLVDITISILFTVVYALVFDLFLYKLQDYKDTKSKLNKLSSKLKKPYIEEFTENCRKANLSKRDTEIAIKYFVEKQKPKEIWIWLCEQKEYEYIEWDSMYILLNRIKKKLNIDKA